MEDKVIINGKKLDLYTCDWCENPICYGETISSRGDLICVRCGKDTKR